MHWHRPVTRVIYQCDSDSIHECLDVHDQAAAWRVLNDAALTKQVEGSGNSFASSDDHLRELFLREVSGNLDELAVRLAKLVRERLEHLAQAMHDILDR